MSAETQTAPPSSAETRRRTRRRRVRLGGATGIVLGTVALFAVSVVLEPESVRHSSLLGMLPFAAILAIVAVGQTLVIQQGGIDLSVPGMISLTVVIMTRYPNGDSGKVAVALLLAFGAALVAGLITGLLVSRVGITAIVTTLGMNALLYGAVIQISGGTPRTTTGRLHDFATGTVLGVPVPVIVAVVLCAVVW